jgi:ketosteroid isomerase-like protein
MTEMNPERTRNLALLRRLYDGLESGRVEEIIATFSPAIVVHLRGAGQLDGTFRGLAEARAAYQRVLAVLGAGFKVPPYEVLVHDETLVVVPHGSGFGDASHGLDVYHVEDGAFSEAWLTAWPPVPSPTANETGAR